MEIIPSVRNWGVEVTNNRKEIKGVPDAGHRYSTDQIMENWFD